MADAGSASPVRAMRVCRCDDRLPSRLTDDDRMQEQLPDRGDQRRRLLLGTAALGAGVAPLRFAQQAQAAPSTQVQTSATFSRIKQVRTGVLDIGYAEDGPKDGTPVVLLHGWPYDIHAYVDVAPLLAAKGYRVLVPHLRGYGTTRLTNRVI